MFRFRERMMEQEAPLQEETDGLFFASTQRSNFELQRVPPRERDSALDDVWGRQRVVAAAEVAEVGEAEAAVAAAAQLEEEDPEQQNNRILQTMQRHVTQHRMKPAFYKALFLNPLYAYSMSLLKLFYNPEDPKKAAQQYCQHWEFKLKFFGLEQLPKPLTAKQSLQSQDKACLYSGCMQLFRDDHGRIVLCLLPSLLSKQQANGNSKQDDCKHLVRAMWYVLVRAMQEENDTGIVILVIGQDKEDLFAKTILASNSFLSQALPINILAIHMIHGHDMQTSLLHNSETSDAVNSVLALDSSSMDRLEETVGRLTRLRLRQHNLHKLYNSIRNSENKNQTPLELLQKRLQKFGISYLPLNPDGSLVMNNPLDSTSKRYFFHKPEATAGTCNILPKPQDVLLGRGRPFQEFPGNMALNDALDNHRQAYKQATSRRGKTNLSQKILQDIQRKGGRFLKQQGGDHWVIVTDLVAREKIAHGFRMPRKQARDEIHAQQQEQHAQQVEGEREEQQQEQPQVGIAVAADVPNLAEV